MLTVRGMMIGMQPAMRTPESQPDPGSLYALLGPGCVAALGARWTDATLADVSLRPWFGALGPVELARVRVFHASYLAYCLGGPPSTAEDLAYVHAVHAIPQPVFEQVLDHLAIAAGQSGIARRTTDKIVGIVRTLAPQIVSAGPRTSR